MEEFQSLAAHFGPTFPQNGLRVFAVQGEPVNGCSTMVEAPKSNFSIRGVSPRFVALVQRGDCTFAGKKGKRDNKSHSLTKLYCIF